MNNPLQQAITNYQVGLGYCLTAAQSQDAVALGQAATYMNQGDTNLQAAIDILEDARPVESPKSAVLFV